MAAFSVVLLPTLLVLPLLLLHLSCGVSSFRLPKQTFSYARHFVLSPSRINTAADTLISDPSTAAVDEREMFKIFCRLADKRLLLDVPGAGTPEMRNCCHGGCDNCPYSHVFDEMTAGRAKWVPLYGHRQLIDGREHSSAWSDIFDTASTAAATVTEAQFIAALQKLPAQLCMGGPSGSLPSPDEAPSEAALTMLWRKMLQQCSDSNDISSSGSSGGEGLGDGGLTVAQVAAALRQLSDQEHGARWADFKKIFQ